MKMFLARATIQTRHYMSDSSEEMDFRIVLAEDERKAGEKYTAFWESQSVDYSHSYGVYDLIITPVLG